MNNFLFEP
jgi:hypothetical protein